MKRLGIMLVLLGVLMIGCSKKGCSSNSGEPLIQQRLATDSQGRVEIEGVGPVRFLDHRGHALSSMAVNAYTSGDEWFSEVVDPKGRLRPFLAGGPRKSGGDTASSRFELISSAYAAGNGKSDYTFVAPEVISKTYDAGKEPLSNHIAMMNDPPRLLMETGNYSIQCKTEDQMVNEYKMMKSLVLIPLYLKGGALLAKYKKAEKTLGYFGLKDADEDLLREIIRNSYGVHEEYKVGTLKYGTSFEKENPETSNQMVDYSGLYDIDPSRAPHKLSWVVFGTCDEPEDGGPQPELTESGKTELKKLQSRCFDPPDWLSRYESMEACQAICLGDFGVDFQHEGRDGVQAACDHVKTKTRKYDAAEAARAYLAMCPHERKTVKQWTRKCERKFARGDIHGDCAFILCAVEVGKCNNEERGDASIQACMVRKGWAEDHRADKVAPSTGKCGNSPLFGRYLWEVGGGEVGTIRPLGADCTLDIGKSKKSFVATVRGTTIAIESKRGRRAIFELTRDFDCARAERRSYRSQEQKQRRCRSYQCALALDPNLYAARNAKGEYRMIDSLFYVTDRPFPGEKVFKSSEIYARVRKCGREF